MSRAIDWYPFELNSLLNKSWILMRTNPLVTWIASLWYAKANVGHFWWILVCLRWIAVFKCIEIYCNEMTRCALSICRPFSFDCAQHAQAADGIIRRLPRHWHINWHFYAPPTSLHQIHHFCGFLTFNWNDAGEYFTFKSPRWDLIDFN